MRVLKISFLYNINEVTCMFYATPTYIVLRTANSFAPTEVFKTVKLEQSTQKTIYAILR